MGAMRQWQPQGPPAPQGPGGGGGGCRGPRPLDVPGPGRRRLECLRGGRRPPVPGPGAPWPTAPHGPAVVGRWPAPLGSLLPLPQGSLSTTRRFFIFAEDCPPEGVPSGAAPSNTPGA